MPTREIRAKSVISPWWAITLLPVLAGFYGPRSLAAGIILVIPAMAVAAVISERRSRKSVLHVDDWPIMLGQPFRGHVAAEFDSVPEHDFWLVLRCTELKGGGDDARLVTLWQDELTIDTSGVTKSDGVVQVPFGFELPIAGKVSGGAVKWRLQVSSSGYATQFDLPVTSGSAAPAVSEERTRMFSTSRDSLRRS
jgi:hypothetical protein